MFDQKNTGIISVLDGKCHFKRGTVERFTLILLETWARKGKCFVQPTSIVRNRFGANHYAAFVNYNTEEWLEKKTGGVREEAYQCILSFGGPFIWTLTPKDFTSDKCKQRVTFRFKAQLADLLVDLESTETQFIRCITPNVEASPSTLNNCLKSPGMPCTPLGGAILANIFVSSCRRQRSSYTSKKNFKFAATNFLIYH
ncbi:myosin heavy chain [Trypanosoma rangeli]|uniref:Myosin heavy chain n=1 Tax=Trypanosoma rangeli TaxID=5698 RepID=A0A3R7KET4_TRYRA|nr:myosin heavy chain [Trypanosoma rangeli]RNF05058.1 myosin heavy chain [Trypanosoma rangeli]|eukprot:RNF05058.1 myosin heavy chain [Trypanosoma rangeli]